MSLLDFEHGCPKNATFPFPDFAPGVVYAPSWFDKMAQKALVEELRAIAHEAPLFSPLMPRTGQAMSVKMTSCGTFGWYSDKDGGYRYETCHPETKQPWPPMPEILLATWRAFAGDYPHAPDSCLINYYSGAAKMGLHQDRNEEDFAAPVVSISLGDTCVFRIGSTKTRGGTTKSLHLFSGDVLVMGGPSRLIYHGVDRVMAGTCDLLKEGGRINLTMRRVKRSA